MFVSVDVELVRVPSFIDEVDADEVESLVARSSNVDSMQRKTADVAIEPRSKTSQAANDTTKTDT